MPFGAIYDRHSPSVHKFVVRATYGHATLTTCSTKWFLTASKIAARYERPDIGSARG